SARSCSTNWRRLVEMRSNKSRSQRELMPNPRREIVFESLGPDAVCIKLGLQILRTGPQLPRTLANRIGLPEQKIFSIASELLARDLIRIVLVAPVSQSQTPALVKEQLKTVSANDQQLSQQGA